MARFAALIATMFGSVAVGADPLPPLPAWKGEVDPPAAGPGRPAGEPPAEIVFPEPPAACVRFSEPAGRFLLAGRAVYDLWAGKTVGGLPSDVAVPGFNEPVAVSPDGTRVAVMGMMPGANYAERIVHLYDVAAGKLARSVPLPSGRAWLAFGAGDVILSGATSESILEGHSAGTAERVWAVARPPTDESWQMPNPRFAVSPGGRFVAVLTGTRVRVVRADTGAVVGTLPVPFPSTASTKSMVRAGLGFSPDGTKLTAAYAFPQPARLEAADARAYTWDLRTGREVGYVPIEVVNPGNGAVGFAWSADGSAWLIGNVVIDPGTGKTLCRVARDDNGTAHWFAESASRTWMVEPFGPRARVRRFDRPAAAVAAARAAVRAGGEAIDAGLPPVLAPDLRPARAASSPGAWAVRPDPAPPGPPVPVPPDLPAGDGALLSFRVAGGPAGGGVVLEWGTQVTTPNGHVMTDDTRPRVVQRVDPRTGKFAGRVDLPAGLRIVHAGPDGDLVATTDVGAGDRIDVWSLSAGKHIVGWRPFVNFPVADRKVVFAAITAPDRVVTVGAGGAVAVWEVPTASPVGLAEAPRFLSPVLTPGRTYLVGRTDAGVWLIHTRTGAVAGQLAYPPVPGGRPAGLDPPGTGLAVNPTGAEVLLPEVTFPGGPAPIGYGGRLTRWDMTAGGPAEVTDTGSGVYWGTGGPEGPPAFMYTGPDHLLLSGRTLFDLRRREVVWQYSLGTAVGTSPFGPRYWLGTAGGPDPPPPPPMWAAQVPDARSWFATPGPWTIAAFTLPGERERVFVRAASTDAPRLGPGTKVRVTVRVQGPDADIVREALIGLARGRVAERGWTPTEDGTEVGVVVTAQSFVSDPGAAVRFTCIPAVTAGGFLVWRGPTVGAMLPFSGTSPLTPEARRQTLDHLRKYPGDLKLPTHVGKTADGYVAVPGNSTLTPDGQIPQLAGWP